MDVKVGVPVLQEPEKENATSIVDVSRHEVYHPVYLPASQPQRPWRWTAPTHEYEVTQVDRSLNRKGSKETLVFPAARLLHFPLKWATP